MDMIFLAVLGLCLGSFVNALVYRLHEQSKGKKGKKLSISKGRSICPHCKHQLSWADLVPVLSWVALKGRCRYCRKKIGWQYPIVELSTAVVFVVSGVFWPLEAINGHSWLPMLNLATWLVFVVGFMALIVYDLRWMLLPNRVIYPLIALAAIVGLINIVWGGGAEVAYGLLFGVIVGGGLFFLLYHVSDGKWIGGGDVKLGVLSGLILASPSLAFLMLFFASALGTLTVLPALLTKRLKTNSRIPFGPFLVASTVVVMLFGQLVVDWYKNSLGL